MAEDDTAITLEGLSEEEAAQRLLIHGPNALPEPASRGPARLVVETLREPMFLLMIGAAVLYLAIGDLAEGLFLVLAALVATGLVVAQEARSEKALAALRDLSKPLARVLRGGVERRVPVRELAPGDLFLVGEGDRLPADGVMAKGDLLSVDESVLTGESAPVAKVFDRALPASREALPDAAAAHLFSGTLVVQGQAIIRATRTGPNTALGRIGRSLSEIQAEPSPLQAWTARLVRLVGAAALVLCALMAVGWGLARRDWIEGALYGVTAAIALVPEEIPMVMTIFLAFGAWRLAAHRVVVRRNAAIEVLGGATVLCVDKTGTLTENRMRVERTWAPVPEDPLTEARSARELVALGALASTRGAVDPMDRALQAKAEPQSRVPVAGEDPVRVWPLRRDRMAVVQLWRRPDGGETAVAKGAPEAILRLCRSGVDQAEVIQEKVAEMARSGLRVLAVATCRPQTTFAEEPETETFTFEGLIGFLDPLRTDARAALEEARGAGVQVVMITGDHPATAMAVAEAAGLDVVGGVVRGDQIAELPFPSLCELVRDVRVFARISPDQKLLIVEALKTNGEIVVMTGDGVNDAPALQAAHIGVAMGRRGTDVAREASDLVLLDDSFASIVAGVRLGRRIFENLRRALTYVIAAHVPIAGLALAPVLLGLPAILLPMHVVVLELAIDPICALVFEGEPSETTAMRRPPRSPSEPLFGGRDLGMAALQGLLLLTACLGFFVWGLNHLSEAQARGTAFLVLVTGNLVLALSDAATPGVPLFARRRVAFWSVAGLSAVILLAAFLTPALAEVFRIAAPPVRIVALALTAAFLTGAWPAFGRRSHERRATGRSRG